MVEKKTVGWRVKTSDGLYVWKEYSFAMERDTLTSHKRKPRAMSQYEAVKLMLSWMECGYIPTLVRVTRKVAS